jgi:hypothetical protein
MLSLPENVALKIINDKSINKKYSIIFNPYMPKKFFLSNYDVCAK